MTTKCKWTLIQYAQGCNCFGLLSGWCRGSSLLLRKYFFMLSRLLILYLLSHKFQEIRNTLQSFKCLNCCWVVSFSTMRTIAPLEEADASFNSFVDLQRLHRVPVEGFAAFSSLPNIHLSPSIPTHFRGIEIQSHYALYTLSRKLNSRKRAYVNNYCRKFSQYSRRRIQQTMPVLLKHLEIM